MPRLSTRTKKRALIALTAAGVLVAALAAWLFFASRARPLWWIDAAALPQDSAERAAALERGATTALHTVRDDDQDPWGVAMDQDDANAWLRHRLNPWLANRGITAPPFEPRVAFAPGELRIGLGMEPRRIMWAVFDVSFDDGSAAPGGESSLRLSLRETGVGRVPVPRVFVRRVGEPALRSALGQWVRFEDAGDIILRMPGLGLADGRAVRIVDIEFEDQRIIFRCITERAGNPAPPATPPDDAPTP
ncbi:MAG: hypothetical protein ACTS3F_00625 [Phycisphaerales bacterium]